MKPLKWILTLSIATSFGCVTAPKLEERSQIQMGSFVAIQLPKQHSTLFKKSFDHFSKIDQALSTYKKDSEINKLNRRRVTRVSKFTRRSILKAMQISKSTDGLFNPGLGHFTKPFRLDAVDPEPAQKAIPPHFHDSIKVHPTKIEILSRKTSLDFGGIGKGIGVDTVSSFLDKNKVSEYVIRAAGDMRCRHKCIFYVRNPYNRALKIGPFQSKVENLSISTSGAYEKYVGSLDNNHLIEPKTATSQTEVLSITVLTLKDNAAADALATALSVANEEKIPELAKRNNLAYYLILANGEVKWSDNIRNYIDFEDDAVNVIKTK